MDYKNDNIWTMHGDCLDKMKEIPSGSVDMILTDPPYGTVKGISSNVNLSGLSGKYEWDNVIPIKDMMKECHRVLKRKGMMVLFSQEPYTNFLINNTHGNLPFCYRAIWLKNHFGNPLISKTSLVKMFEDICIFRKEGEEMQGHPLQEWFNNKLSDSGLSVEQMISICGSGGVRHHFTNGKVFRIPSQERYEFMRQVSSSFDIPYDDIVEIHKAYKSSLTNRSTFNNIGQPKADVFRYDKDLKGFHPTQKPVDLLSDLINTYSNEGDTVLDFTHGSGSTGVACVKLNRRYIGIEKDDEFYIMSISRILDETVNQC